MSASFFKINQAPAKDLKTMPLIASTHGVNDGRSRMFANSNSGMVVRSRDQDVSDAPPKKEEILIGKIAYLLVVFALPTSVKAQDFPKQGSANYTDYSTIITPKTMTMGKDGSVTNYEVYGVSRNDDGGVPFNEMAIHCMGSSLTANGEITSRGLCIQVDKGGDQIFINYENTGHVGGEYKATEHFVGGTGKYLGITGQADSTRQIVKGPDSTLMLILPHHANWTKP
jgi:hypothetical protein